jgi:hypothetical protein
MDVFIESLKIIILINLISKLIIISQMSGDAETPPTYYFSGMTFNPDFYTSSSSTYITKITGKKYFLTYPTAQGTESITTLNTYKINSSVASDTGDIFIGDSQTSGALNIGAGSAITRTGAINIGSYTNNTNTVNIGPASGTSTTNIYGKGVIYGTKFDVHNNATDVSLFNTSFNGDVTIADSQFSGILNIGNGTARGSLGAINIGSGAVNAVPITIGSSASNTTLNGTSVTITTKLITPKIDGFSATTDLAIGSNLLQGNITIGSAITAGDISLGSSTQSGNILIGKYSTSDTFIGNGTNNNTTVNNGTCYINKLQVGSVATAAGNGLGTGTPFRLVILGTVAGGSGSGTVTIPGAPTSGSNPIVFAQVNVYNTTAPYSINLNPTSVSTFNWAKLYWIGTGFGNPTAEGFNYIAIWL